MKNTNHYWFEIRTNHLKMIFLVIFLTILRCSTSETYTSIFSKSDDIVITLDNYKAKSYITFEKVDFGPLGANRMSLWFKPTVDIKYITENIFVHFDSPNTSPAQMNRLILNNSDDSIGNCLDYNLATPDGVHDVYISIPPELTPTDMRIVQFHKGDFIPEQWYYIIAKSGGKAVTACTSGSKTHTCLHTLRGYHSQKFRFENNERGDGYKIVTSLENKVLSVKDASIEDYAEIVAIPFSNLPNQIWYVEKFEDGLRFRPKHFFKLCMDLNFAKQNEGAPINTHRCFGTQEHMWYLIKAF